MTTTSNPIQMFYGASTFFVDPGAVKNAPEVSITSIDLFFKSKPSITNNASGITAPGVDVFLCELKTIDFDEVPDASKMIRNAHARVEYADILTSTSAATPTKFTFNLPPNIKTGKSYAIVVKFDGSENFVLWKSVEGHKVVGTSNTTAGPSGKYIGKYFEYSQNAGGNTALNSSSGAGGIGGTWKPLNSTDLKFTVRCAKFTPDSFANTTSTDPITGETTIEIVAQRSYILFKDPYEFIVFDSLNSNNHLNIHGGEVIYQNNVVRPETISVVSGETLITSSNANFTSIYGSANNDKYIVVYSGNSKNVRKIETINSNNAITVDIPLTFTNTTASFARVAAGKVDISAKITAFGKLEDAIAISDSNANSTLRFVNNTIESISIANGGTGYANSDYIVVNGGGAGGGSPEANAIANVVTNANGTLTSATVTNKGIGFLDTPSFIILNANGVASAGQDANLSFSVGATLMTEHSNVILANCTVINVPVNTVMFGAVDIENPYGTSYYLKHHYLYYATGNGISDIVIEAPGTGYANDDTVSFNGTGSGASGKIVTDSTGKIVDVRMVTHGSGYVSVPNVSITTSGGTSANLVPVIGVLRNDVNSAQYQKLMTLFERHNLAEANTPLVLSRSYEVTQPNVSITTVTGRTVNTNISTVVEMVTTTNNVYTVADILSSEVDVFYEKYAINNDYTDEHTGNGRAISKHVSQVVSFGDERLAEDIRVFADIYRPANTDIKLYARIYNSKDDEAFVDKDWTLLEVKNNENRRSSPTNVLDVLEFEYGFPSYPNTEVTLVGSAAIAAGESNVAGSGTSYDTDLAADDLIKIYSPLFEENYQIAVVNSVVNSTAFSIRGTVSNNSIAGSGLVIDKLAYPHQAFNNPQNDNVVRYYSNSMAELDGFNTFALKFVFLSDDELTVPKIENVRAVGVTA